MYKLQIVFQADLHVLAGFSLLEERALLVSIESLRLISESCVKILNDRGLIKEFSLLLGNCFCSLLCHLLAIFKILLLTQILLFYQDFRALQRGLSFAHQIRIAFFDKLSLRFWVSGDFIGFNVFKAFTPWNCPFFEHAYARQDFRSNQRASNWLIII